MRNPTTRKSIASELDVMVYNTQDMKPSEVSLKAPLASIEDMINNDPSLDHIREEFLETLNKWKYAMLRDDFPRLLVLLSIMTLLLTEEVE